MKTLLVRKPWIDLILEGRKTWELRGSSTRVRGQIALVESGSGTVVGVCEVVEVVGPLSLDDLRRSVRRHRIPASQLGTAPPYRRTHAWVLDNARRLPEPVPYAHPQGAVIWVNLATGVARKVVAAARTSGWQGQARRIITK